MARSRERHEQEALILWARYYPVIFDHLIHIPNGGSRNIIEAKHLKNSGVKSGVSDLFLALSNHHYHGLWLELKAKQANGYYPPPTKAQIEWLKRMREAGYDGMVCQGMEQAKDKIIEYLSTTEYSIQ